MHSETPTGNVTAGKDALRVAGAGLLHPVPLAAVALLLLNDHWWKWSYGGGLTGKLSDFAGLAFFPLFLQALWELALTLAKRPWRPSRRALIACAVVAALVFALTQVWSPAGEMFRWALAALQWPFRALVRVVQGAGLPGVAPVKHTADVTDLMALPAVGLAIWAGWKRGDPDGV